MQVINVKYAQFESPYHQSRGIYSHTVSVGEEFLYQLILTLFQTLHAKRHTAQIGNLLFGIPQGKMSQISSTLSVIPLRS